MRFAVKVHTTGFNIHEAGVILPGSAPPSWAWSFSLCLAGAAARGFPGTSKSTERDISWCPLSSITRTTTFLGARDASGGPKQFLGALGRNRTCDTRFRKAIGTRSPTCANSKDRRWRTASAYFQILPGSARFWSSRGPHAAQGRREAAGQVDIGGRSRQLSKDLDSLQCSDVGPKDLLEVSSAKDQRPVQALGSKRPRRLKRAVIARPNELGAADAPVRCAVPVPLIIRYVLEVRAVEIHDVDVCVLLLAVDDWRSAPKTRCRPSGEKAHDCHFPRPARVCVTACSPFPRSGARARCSP